MGTFMNTDSSESDRLYRQAASGRESAFADLFSLHRERLRRMVRLRLDHRLQGRVDPSDVLQEAYLEAARRFGDYQKTQPMPIFLWLRTMTAQKLTDLHRHHLGRKRRDAGREISLHSGPFPEASSVCLANQLLGRLTSASQAAIRAEIKIQIQEALNGMDAIDREVLALRHFEYLSNAETAQVLGIKPNAASNRYIRAVRRLKEILSQLPGIGDVPLT